MRVKITLEGTSPLLQHNVQLADPLAEITREMASVSQKKQKTEDDHAKLAMLEWFGGLNLDEDGRVAVPTSQIYRSLTETAKIWKLGRSLERAVSPTGPFTPLEYEGSDRKVEDLYADGDFVSRLSVKIGQSRVMRVRPKFFPWKAEAEFEFMEDAGIDFDRLQKIAETAGFAQGIGDGRRIGYGRFTAKVEEVKS